MNHHFNVNYLFSRLHVYHLKTATSPLWSLTSFFSLPYQQHTTELILFFEFGIISACNVVGGLISRTVSVPLSRETFSIEKPRIAVDSSCLVYLVEWVSSS